MLSPSGQECNYLAQGTEDITTKWVSPPPCSAKEHERFPTSEYEFLDANHLEEG